MTRLNVFATSALLLSSLIACGGEPSAAEPPVRETLAIRYVSEPEVQVHAQPDPSSPVLANFQFAETVSVLADQGEWSEIRVNLDQSGWALRSQLSDTSPQAPAAADGSPTPRFKVPPSPIFSPGGASGEIVLEASVNTAGRITDIRTIRNTTGRPDLEAQNKAELMKAEFYPLRSGGELRPFIYEHRVTY